MASFIFDANKMTPEQLARRRDLANLMMAKATSRAPRDVGEGLNAIGQAIAGRVIDNRTGAEEDRRRSAASEAFSSALSGWGMGDGGATPSGASAATPAAPASITGDKQSFVDMILPAALREGQGIGVDPRIIVAQAALESGWGKSAPGNNYFGIKSHGQPGGMTLPTTEYVGGQKVNVSDSFRRFDSPDAAVSGYARFLTENPRYRPMLGAAGNFDKQIEELGKSGYATDPNYAAKVAQIARGITLPETASDAAPAMTGGAPMAAPAPAAPQGGGLDPALIKLMGDPYLSDGQRAVLSAIVEQRMKSMDPANRLALEKAQLEIEGLRNPQAKPTDDIREYEFARSQGYGGTFQEWQEFIRKSGATNVTVGGGKYGTIPQGYMLNEGPGGASLAPIPGGPAAAELADAERQQAERDKSRNTSANLVLDEIDIARQLITGNPGTTTGVVGSVLSSIDQTTAGAVKNRLATIKANIGFDKLQAMREASPTGGALGQVSEFENRLLQAVYGSLEQAQRPEDILYNLDRLESLYNRVVNDGIPDEEARAIYRDIVLGKKQDKGGEVSLDDLLNKYGG